MNAFAFSACRAADVALVNFDTPPLADLIAIRANHASAKLMQKREGRFVPCKAELPLELCRRHARRLRRHKIRAPEPRRKRRARALHHASGGKVGVLPAGGATKNNDRTGHPPWIALMSAWARKALGPTQGFQVLGASLIVREELLELRKRRGKAERFHVPIVSETAGDGNRISMHTSIVGVPAAVFARLFGSQAIHNVERRKRLTLCVETVVASRSALEQIDTQRILFQS
jgi:hypothetical protein